MVKRRPRGGRPPQRPPPESAPERRGGRFIEGSKQSTVHHPPSTIHRPPSTVRRPPSTVHHPPSTIHRPPRNVYYPPSTVPRGSPRPKGVFPSAGKPIALCQRNRRAEMNRALSHYGDPWKLLGHISGLLSLEQFVPVFQVLFIVEEAKLPAS